MRDGGRSMGVACVVAYVARGAASIGQAVECCGDGERGNEVLTVDQFEPCGRVDIIDGV